MAGKKCLSALMVPEVYENATEELKPSKLAYNCNRTKTVDERFLKTELRRCLTTFDITLIGVGHMIGAGIYVLTGSEARRNSGPGVLLSYVLAAIASLLSALCYAEFGARVPKAGSAYTYTYVTVGEVWAFIIGWDMVLEYMVGAAAVGRSLSGYIQSVICGALHHSHHIATNVTHLTGNFSNSTVDDKCADGTNITGEFDYIAFGVIILVCLFMASGVKISTWLNTIFTLINLTIIGFVICYGFYLAEPKNWGSGIHGFLPFGFGGVMKAGASCFFAYAGFDGIATSGEEAKNPSRSIPLATFYAMSIVTFCYCAMSACLTLMVPYYLISEKAAFAEAFVFRGIEWARYVVSVGAIAGMTTSLIGSLFSLPRTAYAMAADGILFRGLAIVHPKTQVPIVSIAVFGGICAVIALFFDVDVLVDLLAIGTLNAYSLVSASVIILRYYPADKAKQIPEVDKVIQSENATMPTQLKVFGGQVSDINPTPQQLLANPTYISDHSGRLKLRFQKIPVINRLLGGYDAGVLVARCVYVQIALLICVGIVIKYAGDYDARINILLIPLSVPIIATLVIICMHEQSNMPLRFKVALTPLIPFLSIAINTILVTSLAPVSWLRFIIWLIIGMLIYFFYGVWHSSENPEYVKAVPQTGQTIQIAKM